MTDAMTVARLQQQWAKQTRARKVSGCNNNNANVVTIRYSCGKWHYRALVTTITNKAKTEKD